MFQVFFFIKNIEDGNKKKNNIFSFITLKMNII